MVKLDYNEFKEFCMKNIEKALGEGKYKAVSNPLRKTDEIVFDSIQIMDKSVSSGSVPSFRVEPFYSDYSNGKALGAVLSDIVRMIEGLLDGPLGYADPSIFNAFDNAKDCLIIRPINFTSNRKLLQEHVHKPFGDVAIVLYIMMQRDSKTMATAKVAKKIAADWCLSDDFLLQTALENTARLFPPYVVPAEMTLWGNETISRIPSQNRFFMNPILQFNLLPSATDTYYLAIDDGINGASAVFYPGTLERLADLLDDDLNITFPCVREALVHPVSKSSVNALRCGAESMTSAIELLERLSASVFHYSRSDKKLRML